MELLSKIERNWCDLGGAALPCPSAQAETPETQRIKYEAGRRTEKLRVERASGVPCPCEIHRGRVAATNQYPNALP
jgi:hypothetical protein